MEATDQLNALQIAQVQDVSASDCAVPGSRTTVTRSYGRLDVDLPRSSAGNFSVPQSYRLPLLVINNLDSVGGGKSTEMNNILLTHFNVTLEADGVAWSDSCPATFDTDPFTYQLGPAGSALGTMVMVVTPYHVACLFNAFAVNATYRTAAMYNLKVSVKAKGTHGGTRIESSPFVYSIRVCAGCLQNYNDPAYARYNYPKYPSCDALTGNNPYPGNPCYGPGQDTTIMCCGAAQSASSIDVLCPAVPSGTTGTATNTSTAQNP
jgi:hypothetical protein